MGSISLYFILAIMLCCTPIVVWLVWRGTKFGHRKWEEHRNAVDAKFYAPRIEEQRRSQVPDPSAMAQRGRYDMQVEEMLRGQLYPEARQLCMEHLANEFLGQSQREMYERYVRVIDEQLIDQRDS
ncbi:hypothetical protein KDL29_05875 [bacterium]|nr:hypothetical protein [bacterium]UNM09371.1 MAG: hypothetical protein H7A35_04775 [Planctomycetales bacterium]